MRPRKVVGPRRKPYYADRRPYAYDDYETDYDSDIPAKRISKENGSVLENRKTQSEVTENKRDETEVQPKSSSGKKLSIYLQPRPPPKFNGKLYKSLISTTSPATKMNESKETKYSKEEYEDYDDADRSEDSSTTKAAYKKIVDKSIRDASGFDRLSYRDYLSNRGGPSVKSIRHAALA